MSENDLDTIRLVIVEDHEALREGLELLLAREGCDVVGTAGTSQEGRWMVEGLDPDVALIDVRLGDGNGIDLARRLLAVSPRRGIVLYTGSADLDQLFEGLDSGARGYALKDGPPQELMEAISAVAAGGTYVDPRLRPALLSPRATQRAAVLSKRERQIMALLAEGMTGEQVAENLVLSTETIKTHVRNVMAKLEARNRVHAIAIALREGEITLDQGAR